MRKLCLLFIMSLLLCNLAGCSTDNNKEISVNKENEIEVISDSGPSNDQDNKEIVDSLILQEENTQEELGLRKEDENVINIWSLTGDLTNVINAFTERHPDFPYEIRITDLSQANYSYEVALNDTLTNGSEIFGLGLPDIYSVDMSYAFKYTKGDTYQYAADYKDLAIDLDRLLEEASIPQYFIDLCTSPEGKLVGLGYENTSGAFIYRRSIAKDVWGTDDPSAIGAIIGPGWEKFFEAAKDLKEKNYGICSGVFDIWHSVANSAEQGWLVDDKLYIDPKREEFLEYAKILRENDYTNNTLQWTDEWFMDMEGGGDKEIFGFFGPSWFVNYIMHTYSGGAALGEGTYSDLAICKPPVGFFWGGTVFLAHKDTKYKEAVGEIIKWLTLDTSETGFQYLWASGEDLDIGKGVPLSSTVAKDLEASIDILGGQDMFDLYTSATKFVRGDNFSMYDEIIDYYWRSNIIEYIEGRKPSKEALNDFKQDVTDFFLRSP